MRTRLKESDKATAGTAEIHMAEEARMEAEIQSSVVPPCPGIGTIGIVIIIVGIFSRGNLHQGIPVLGSINVTRTA